MSEEQKQNMIKHTQSVEINKKRSEFKKKYYKQLSNEEKQKLIDNSHTEQVNNKRSITLKNRFKEMTKEEIENRLQKSLRNCDHKLRGEAISKAKKGKTTNQNEITGKRYTQMSIDDFNILIKDRIPRIKKKMINLRRKYLNV